MKFIFRLSLILASMQLGLSPALADTTFYVALDGSDSNPGSLTKPFATLHRARDATRELKRSQGPMPVKVIVRAGKYFLDRCLELTQIDSGTTATPVLYASHSGEKVLISGGVRITGWTRHRDQIMKANLPAGEWAVGKCRQLTFNGQLQTRARWPNFDANVNPVIGDYLNIEDAAEPGSDTAFRYQEGGLPRAWKKPHLAEAMVTVAGGWATNVVPVARVD